ncbi:hypothetical protein [Saccharothrix xinjiangensis]|uniref:Secreted protein n=1 Tax=Saccharothrix xinjiangensis TaxID=204798 RepID=A0ABV9XT65_9PSEU
MTALAAHLAVFLLITIHQYPVLLLAVSQEEASLDRAATTLLHAYSAPRFPWLLLPTTPRQQVRVPVQRTPAAGPAAGSPHPTLLGEPAAHLLIRRAA